MEQDFYEIRTEDEPGTLNRLVKAFRIIEIPIRASTILGDALGQIRSSLDHLAVGLAKFNGAENTRTVSFPFAKTKKNFESDFIQNQIKKLSQKHIKMICDLEPYKGGNDLLWAINEACNTDKHDLLVPVTPFQKGISRGEAKVTKQGILGEEGSGVELFNPKDWSKAEEGVLLARVPPKIKLEMSFDLSVDMVFGKIELLEGNPIFTNLEKMRNLAEHILLIFENDIKNSP